MQLSIDMHMIPVKKLTIILFLYLKLVLNYKDEGGKKKASLCEVIYTNKNIENIEKGEPRLQLK